MEKLKEKRDFKGIIKHGGVFFLGLISFMLLSDLLPQQKVEVTREELTQIELEEGKVTEKYNSLSEKVKEEKETLLSTKSTLDEENKGLESKIKDLNKEIESLKGN